MKTSKKILVAVIAILITACTLAFAACEPDEVDDGIDKALALASSCDKTSMTLSSGGNVYYSFTAEKDGDVKVNDPYSTGINPAQFIDFAKEITIALSVSDLTMNEYEYSAEGGSVRFSATIKSASEVLGADAENAVIMVDANVITEEMNVYKVTYEDAQGYTVEINLGK